MAYRVSIRRFLNLADFHAGAYALARVEDSSALDPQEDDWRFVEITLTLADCGRAVSFDFDLESSRARRNSLRKADIMVEALTQFRDALREEAKLAAKRERAARHLPSE